MTRDPRPPLVRRHQSTDMSQARMALPSRSADTRTFTLVGGHSPVIAGLVQALPLALCLWAGVLGIVGLVF